MEMVDRAIVPERAAGYAEEVWRQVIPQIARESERERTTFFRRLVNLQFPRWAIACGFGLLLFGAFLAGLLFPARHATPKIAAVQSGTPISDEARERILFREIGDHLERSQLALIELINAKTNGVVDITEEQDLARQLIQVNRLYRRTALRMGENTVAVLLDDLERTLIEVANSPPQLTEAQVDEMHQRFDEEDLLFKVRVFGELVRVKELETARRIYL